MKAKSKAGSLARTTGYQYRKVFKQGPDAAKVTRNFSRMASNRAMRAHSRWLIEEGICELSSEKP